MTLPFIQRAIVRVAVVAGIFLVELVQVAVVG